MEILAGVISLICSYEKFYQVEFLMCPIVPQDTHEGAERGGGKEDEESGRKGKQG